MTAPVSVVTMGNFDGVHRGHRALVDRTVARARADGLRAVAVTFDPHPAAVLRPGSEPPLLQTVADRVATLEAAGIDHVEVVRFDADLAAMSAERFVDEVLVGGLGARAVVVGANIRFGHRAAADLTTLEALGRARGLAVEGVDLVAIDGTRVSSTVVRGLIAAGEVSHAAELLGRPFTLAGEVVRGDGRGRTLGIPTANIAVPAGLVLPADGVYAGAAALPGGRTALAVTNVGVRPTFDGHRRTVEAHLPGLEVDLYGERLVVGLALRVRGERRFEGPEALRAQVAADVAVARGALGDRGVGHQDGSAAPGPPA